MFNFCETMQHSLASFQLLALLRSFCNFRPDHIFLSFQIFFKFEENEKESLFQIFLKVSLFCSFETTWIAKLKHKELIDCSRVN